MTALRDQIRTFLELELDATAVTYEVEESVAGGGYTRQRIAYTAADGDLIPAFLFIPDGGGPFPALIIHHQHASQRHLGKSEVAGVTGDRWQAFGPALAQRGFAVLAPDSICFEDRRRHATGTEAHPDDDLQHFREMGQRLVGGDTLMRKVLADASSGVSLLAHQRWVDARRLGALGHSYGGNTVLFQAALDPRIAFAAASGALCSYAYKRRQDIALEMALVIPGFAARWDLHHLLACSASRPLLIVSSRGDPYSQDAPEVIARAEPNDHISHVRYGGGHDLTAERFQQIVEFIRVSAGQMEAG